MRHNPESMCIVIFIFTVSGTTQKMSTVLRIIARYFKVLGDVDLLDHPILTPLLWIVWLNSSIKKFKIKNYEVNKTLF